MLTNINNNNVLQNVQKNIYFCILGVLRVLVSYDKTQPGYQLIQYITHMIVIVYYHYFLMCLETIM